MALQHGSVGHLAALIANCHRMSEQAEKAEQNEQEHTGLARRGKRWNVGLSVHALSIPQVQSADPTLPLR